MKWVDHFCVNKVLSFTHYKDSRLENVNKKPEVLLEQMKRWCKICLKWVQNTLNDWVIALKAIKSMYPIIRCCFEYQSRKNVKIWKLKKKHTHNTHTHTHTKTHSQNKSIQIRGGSLGNNILETQIKWYWLWGQIVFFFFLLSGLS